MTARVACLSGRSTRSPLATKFFVNDIWIGRQDNLPICSSYCLPLSLFETFLSVSLLRRGSYVR
jgi:hypothetical protein